MFYADSSFISEKFIFTNTIPPFEWNTIKSDELFKIGDISIRTQFQKHENGFSLGFVFNEKFAYSTELAN